MVEFTLPDLNRNQLAEEAAFDIDSLPDMDEVTTAGFVHVIEEKKEQAKVEAKTMIKLPKEEETFDNGYFEREREILKLKFKLNDKDKQQIGKYSYGLMTTDLNEGVYEFQIETKPNGAMELYYFDEFVGEILENKPKVYRRYFFAAVVRSMVKQEILLEYERNKFTIHPGFFIKLQLNAAHVARALAAKGFPIIDTAELEAMDKIQEKVDAARRKAKKP